MTFLPMHPEFERQIVTPELAEAREELDRVLRRNCDELGAAYFDFRDLHAFGGDAEEFVDGTHQTPVNLRRMTNVLFGREPQAPFASPPDEDRTEHMAASMGNDKNGIFIEHA